MRKRGEKAIHRYQILFKLRFRREDEVKKRYRDEADLHSAD
jgi:hypothetical protein